MGLWYAPFWHIWFNWRCFHTVWLFIWSTFKPHIVPYSNGKNRNHTYLMFGFSRWKSYCSLNNYGSCECFRNCKESSTEFFSQHCWCFWKKSLVWWAYNRSPERLFSSMKIGDFFLFLFFLQQKRDPAVFFCKDNFTFFFFFSSVRQVIFFLAKWFFFFFLVFWFARII